MNILRAAANKFALFSVFAINLLTVEKLLTPLEMIKRQIKLAALKQSFYCLTVNIYSLKFI